MKLRAVAKIILNDWPCNAWFSIKRNGHWEDWGCPERNNDYVDAFHRAAYYEMLPLTGWHRCLH